MKQKNNTVSLLLLVVLGIGILGGLSWWILQLLGGETRPVNSETKLRNPTTPLNVGMTIGSGFAKSFSEVANIPVGLFSYGGSTTWSPIREKVDRSIQKAWPNFQLRYTDPIGSAPGSGMGIKMLLNDELAFAQSSRSLTTEEYQQATERGFKLKQIPIALDGIVIAVHPDLNLKGLTLKQLQDIYTGQITNWQQVGGPNLDIVPYSRPLNSGGTVDYFRENILQNKAFGKNLQWVRDTTQGIRAVSNQPGGLYYASASTVINQCTVKTLPIGRNTKTLVAPYLEPLVPVTDCPNKRNEINREVIKTGQYPITRRLFVIVKENGQLDEQAGNAYAQLLLTDQGQTLISEAGFVKIR